MEKEKVEKKLKAKKEKEKLKKKFSEKNYIIKNVKKINVEWQDGFGSIADKEKIQTVDTVELLSPNSR